MYYDLPFEYYSIDELFDLLYSSVDYEETKMILCEIDFRLGHEVY